MFYLTCHDYPSGLCGVGRKSWYIIITKCSTQKITISEAECVGPGWKSGESNTEIADQIYMQFLHMNTGAQILYNLLRRFIHLPIAALIHSNTNSHGTNYSRKTTNYCDPLYLPEQQT